MLCLVQGGGCLPGLMPRLGVGWERKEESRTIPLPPRDYLRRPHFDTAVFDGTALRRLIEDAGHDRVLLGTDLPFDLADVDAVATVRAQDLDPAAERAILSGNAMRLIPSPAAPACLPLRLSPKETGNPTCLSSRSAWPREGRPARSGA